MYTATQFIEQLVAEFPELRHDIEDETGLLHLQMAAFARSTQAAIDTGDTETLKRHFAFADRFFYHSADDLENALNVSYLENLEFTAPHGESARSLMSPALRQGWQDIMDYLDEVTRRTNAEKHGSSNA
ncbi:MAG: hypothetical protein QOG67_585 [Verrucomicrobiota bacterium]|jgi:hypothetical protein